MAFLRAIVLSLVVAWPFYGHAACRDWVVNIQSAFVSLSGRQFMQEDLPLQEQLIAKKNPTDSDLAYAWLNREGYQSLAEMQRYGGIADYWGPAPGMVEFLPTIPGWRQLRNTDLRRWSALQTVMAFDLGEDIEIARVMIEEHKLKLEDFQNWNKAFPGRQVPRNIMAIVSRE